MKICKGDKVKIISGKSKGAEGVVERVYTSTSKVVVSGANVVTRHMKQSSSSEGGLIKVNKPIHVSNVMLICAKCSKPVRIGMKMVGSKKYKVCKKCGEVVTNSKKK